MIEEDIKQITDVKELQRIYIELNNETEKQEKEIERLNDILDTLMQDMAVANAIGKQELKPKYVFDRIAMLRGVEKE